MARTSQAFYKKRVSVADVLARPHHLQAAASAGLYASRRHGRRLSSPTRARHATAASAHPDSAGVVGRCSKPRTDMAYQEARSRRSPPLCREILWPNAGVGPEDVDGRPARTMPSPSPQCAARGLRLCKKGEGGAYVSDGTIRLGGRGPNKPAAGHLTRLHAWAPTW